VAVVEQRWAYLGPAGTFTEQAAHDLRARAGAVVELVPCAGVSAALADVRDGRVDAAVVPLENSVEGSVPLTHDELIHGEPLVLAGEAYVAVTFDLLVRPGTAVGDIRSVGSHPHGHAQVRDWLAAHLPGAEIVTTRSTAEAAQLVQAGEIDAAAAAPVAGTRYGLESLHTDIGLLRDAVTRFVLVRRPGPPPAPTGNDRSTLTFSVENTPGALLGVLTEITGRGINMVRLESRPTRNRLGEYHFLVDIDGHLAEPAVRDMVTALIRTGALLRWLGSYPRAHGVNVPLPEFARPQTYLEAERQVGELLGGSE
jgi:prephenate dehydratase